jgi:uncharacterized protein YoxC
LPSLAQVSLILVRALDSGSGQAAAQAFLQKQAKKLGSRYLALAAARITADPFKKVKKMIKDLITKLMEEANAEADHKGFCDAEMATNKQTRDNLSAEVDELNANIDERTAEISQLTTAISDLTTAISDIKAQQAEATALRQEEKEKNMVTIGDATDGQKAVEQALKVLKDFYEGAAFVQGGAGIKGAMDGAAKATKQDATGVLGMLEVILSDFARLESETSSTEDKNQAEYEKFMADTQQDAEVKQTEVDHKSLKKQSAEEALADLKKDLERTNEELSSAMDYYEKLKPDCIDSGESYEEKVARRKEEIVSLQEALKILSGDAIA